MNGARALLSTLVDAGVDVCFANPGTSEMHFVAALDDVPAMRGVLCLFEGVVTGAADGYGRVAGRPAATLLHLGPGLGNGLANLHNARRARTPIVNIVGDHATYHARYDAPLQSDIASIAGAVSGWYRSTARADDVAADGADAVAAALGPPGCVATLVLPADASWSESATGPCPPRPRGRPAVVPADTIDEVAKALRSGERAALLLGGRRPARRRAARSQPGGRDVGRRCSWARPSRPISNEARASRRWTAWPTWPRWRRPSSTGSAPRPGRRQVAGVLLRLPGQGQRPGAAGVHRAHLGPARRGRRRRAGGTGRGARRAGRRRPCPHPRARPDRPTGAVTTETLAAAVGATLPEGAIVVDEGNTSGLFVPAATAGAPRHDWLTLTGGAIGIGLPMATGAAVAAPERPVLCLQADGSAMYTLQALWTQAREGLNVTTLLLSNRSYAILNMELHRVGADAGGPLARRLLDLTDPELDFCDLARGMGVPARRVENAEDLVAALEAGFAEAGPDLIEVLL